MLQAAHKPTHSVAPSTQPAPAGSGVRALRNTEAQGQLPLWSQALGDRPLVGLFTPGVKPPPIQPNLVIGQPNDPYEQEADRVAEQVMRMPDPTSPGPSALPETTIQRKCACGGEAGPDGECEQCKARRLGLQRKASATADDVATAPPIVQQVLQSEGQPLDESTRAFMEPRFGMDFSHVRVHTDRQAAESARSVNALAYTVGQHIVFGANQYPHAGSPGAAKLLAHELTHVAQQTASRDNGQATIQPIQPESQVTQLGDGAYRIAVAPQSEVGPESDTLEREADTNAERVIGSTNATPTKIAANRSPITAARSRGIQRMRVALPRPRPLCGRTLTHIDIFPPRWRDLEPCKPPGFPVNRVNIIGRDLSGPVTGAGPQVFNLHIGYYRDPATGRLCGIVDDSKSCLIPRCVELGCFPTLQEVVEKILDFLKSLLEFIGILILVIILFLIGRGLIRGGAGAPGGAPVPIAEAGEEESGEDSSALASAEGTEETGEVESA